MSTSNHSLSSESAGNPEDQARAAAELYVEQLRAFYIHATVFAVGIVIIFVVNLATNMAAGITGEWSAWWSGWALIAWSIAIAIHGLVVRYSRTTNSASSWTEQKINKVLSEASGEPPR